MTNTSLTTLDLEETLDNLTVITIIAKQNMITARGRIKETKS